MTTIIRHYCDKCRTEIETDRTELVVEFGRLRNRRESVELCKGCVDALEGWLSGSALVGEPVAGKPEPQPPANAMGLRQTA